MNALKQLLKIFDEILRKNNSANYQKLQNPLPETEIDDYMKKLGVEDEDFKLLYSWKNGMKAQYGAGMRDQIFDFGALVSLQYLLKDSSESQTNPWSKNFIPIVMDGDGAALLFNKEKGANHGKLYLYCVPLLFIEEPITYYDSIETMIKTTIEAYNEEALHYNDMDNWLDRNTDQFYQIAAKNNPNSDYWKLEE